MPGSSLLALSLGGLERALAHFSEFGLPLPQAAMSDNALVYPARGASPSRCPDRQRSAAEVAFARRRVTGVEVAAAVSRGWRVPQRFPRSSRLEIVPAPLAYL